ncbi:hypothetical protein [Enterobacter sp. RHBSTW-00975]|uniref:hypothetical protein n=1 Tax=Enterobacter sp. RHBSTW-00975 TaxID=2742673 RepID=UPI0015E55D6F|nr:hypothetical protein [Enterobacter sp. RHBSTW-00975]QLO88711.1 hypothetical protein HV340_08865 [Enterobacter sp. RHBSTW-00975]
MKYIISTAVVLIFTFLLLCSLFIFNPALFKDVKITDYISAISSMVSLLIAFYAFYFAKDYLVQEKRKNAAKLAFDIIQKDLPQISQLDEVFDSLYVLEQTIKRFHKSLTPDEEHYCIDVFIKYNEKLSAVVKDLHNKNNILKTNLLSASILGCKIRDDVDTFDKILRNHQFLMLSVIGIREVLITSLEYENNEELGQFVNPGKVESQLDKLNDSITQSLYYYKQFNNEVSKIQSDTVDVDSLFVFK